MKKIIILLLLTSVLTFGLPGCGGGPSGPPPPPPCIACGFLPNARVLVRYTDGLIIEWFADILGCAVYPKRNGDCGQVFPTINFGFNLSASPSNINLNAAPSSATISGQGLNAAYGMPQVKYFDGDGYMVGATTATWVSGDGTQMVAPVPDLSYAWSGTYQIVVTNMQSSGLYSETVGSAWVSCWGRDRPDSDGDGFYDDEDCYPWDYTRWSCYEPPAGCGGNQNPHMEQMPICDQY